MDWRTGLVWHFFENEVWIFGNIFKVFVTLLKNSLNVSSTSLSLEMIFCIIGNDVSVILSLNLILFDKNIITYEFYIKEPFWFSKKKSTNVFVSIQTFRW